MVGPSKLVKIFNGRQIEKSHFGVINREIYDGKRDSKKHDNYLKREDYGNVEPGHFVVVKKVEIHFNAVVSDDRHHNNPKEGSPGQ